jgi:glycosyltransferase involved in cell wall biosynthesis
MGTAPPPVRRIAPPPDALFEGHPEVSVVVPASNEARRLGPSLDTLAADPSLRRRRTEVIVVDDGSHDTTAVVAVEHLVDLPRGRLLRLPWHLGKGAAVRFGVASARGDVVVFMDADLATDLAALPRLFDELERADVVVGSRRAPGAVVEGVTYARALMHDAFSSQASRMHLGVSDPQCGFKGFSAQAAATLFPLSRVDGFGFDIEILLLARRLGLRVVEVPVHWHAVAGSKVRPLLDPLTMTVDVMRTRLRHARHHVNGNGRPRPR